MISRAVKTNLIHGWHVGVEDVVVSQLQFDEDAILFLIDDRVSGMVLNSIMLRS